jgi:hypothetical protein
VPGFDLDVVAVESSTGAESRDARRAIVLRALVGSVAGVREDRNDEQNHGGGLRHDGSSRRPEAQEEPVRFRSTVVYFQAQELEPLKAVSLVLP